MIHRLAFRAMGTNMLACLDVDSDQVPDILAQVPGWFEGWEQTLSRFRLDSELSRLNRSGGRPMPVSDALWQVFQASLDAAAMTDGLVTPTVAESMLEFGYDRDFDLLAGTHIPSRSPVLTEIRPLSTVTWDEPGRTLCLPEGVQLDFGGVAKGWAAHQAMLRLCEYGPALMNAGGDVASSGALRNGGSWEISIINPFTRREEDSLGTILLRGEAVATSGTDRRRWLQGGFLRHHIIDPHTGLPAQTDVLSATVVAPTVLEAEAAAKSALIRGSQAGIAWVDAEPSLAGLLILEDGQGLYNERLKKYL
ncbi:MAG: FAD:protein FMN transferase [Chloroflexi bacterium]|nr:FAD:protein FMN transferase [Chloroflexota bacterium]